MCLPNTLGKSNKVFMNFGTIEHGIKEMCSWILFVYFMDSWIRSSVKCCKYGARKIISKQANNGACEKDFSTREKIGFPMGIDLSTH